MSDHAWALGADLSPREGGVPTATPFRVAQVTAMGLHEQPPVLYLGADAVPVRVMGRLDQYQPGDTVIFQDNAGSPVILGKLPAVGTDPDPDESDPWHEVGAAGEPAFANTWTNFGSVYSTAGFKKQSDGWVALKGLVTGGAGTVFSLPAGCRPPFWCYFTVAASNGVHAEISISTSGSVNYVAGGTGAAWLSLEGIVFPTTWNPAAWHNLTLENDWEVVSTNPGTHVYAYLRDDGWVWLRGRITDGPAATATFHIAVILPERSTMGFKCDLMTAYSVGVVRLDVGGSEASYNRRPNRMVFVNHNELAHAAGVVLGGMNWWGQLAFDTVWWGLDYRNGWAAYVNTDHHVGGYHRDAHGRVHLRGVITAASATSDTAFVLPVGYRPAKSAVFPAIRQPDTHTRVDVNPDGTVEVVGRGTSWVSLSGIHFQADDMLTEQALADAAEDELPAPAPPVGG